MGTDSRGTGRWYTAETGFQIEADPDTVRPPDLAWKSWRTTIT
ncbi:MAG TPA: hypothetical protein VF970_08570 [Gemmatimonadales bacterium]